MRRHKFPYGIVLHREEIFVTPLVAATVQQPLRSLCGYHKHKFHSYTFPWGEIEIFIYPTCMQIIMSDDDDDDDDGFIMYQHSEADTRY